MACGLGFINVYRFSYSTRIEDVYNVKIKIFPIWKRLDGEKLLYISESLLVDDSVCLKNIFKAGGNVIYDWFNGFFGIHEETLQ